MPIQLTDDEISALIAERKPLPPDYKTRFRTKPKRGHNEQELEIIGESGSVFRLILRESQFNPLDFSAILAYLPPGTNHLFRLRRYNGFSHEHSNELEGDRFYKFHIHMATERYQNETGLREDTFAEPTVRYSDLNGAIKCLLRDCGFDVPINLQGSFFGDDD